MIVPWYIIIKNSNFRKLSSFNKNLVQISRFEIKLGKYKKYTANIEISHDVKTE